MPEVDEIADGIHRIATFVPEEGLTFNQFLIAGDEPLLFHTGPRAMFQETLDGIARIMDPARLRWVSWSHFEADECGALKRFPRTRAERRAGAQRPRRWAQRK